MTDPLVLHHVGGGGVTSLVLEASSSHLLLVEVVSPASGVSHASVNGRLQSSHGSPGVLVVVSEDTSSSVEASASGSNSSTSGSNLLEGIVFPLADVVSSVLDEVVDGVLEGLGESVVVADVALDTSGSASSVPESAGPASTGSVGSGGFPVSSRTVGVTSSAGSVSSGGMSTLVGASAVDTRVFSVLTGVVSVVSVALHVGSVVLEGTGHGPFVSRGSGAMVFTGPVSDGSNTVSHDSLVSVRCTTVSFSGTVRSVHVLLMVSHGSPMGVGSTSVGVSGTDVVLSGRAGALNLNGRLDGGGVGSDDGEGSDKADLGEHS